MNSLGFDFEVLWTIGLAVLRGLNPYSISGSLYPPAASLSFALFALVPLDVSYVIVMAIGIIALVLMTKRRALGWLIFSPIILVAEAGQINLLFLIPMMLLNSKQRWISGLAIALLLFKPQIAFVAVPWYLIQWLFKDRRRLSWAFGIITAIHLAPLLYNPAIYGQWLTAIVTGGGHKVGGIGIWMLREHLGFWITALGYVFITLAALTLDEKTCRLVLTFANPTMWHYDTITLIETAPWWVLGPASIVALIAGNLIGHPMTFLLIPIAGLIYRTARHLTIPSWTKLKLKEQTG